MNLIVERFGGRFLGKVHDLTLGIGSNRILRISKQAALRLLFLASLMNLLTFWRKFACPQVFPYVKTSTPSDWLEA